jgi:hypothetical protein
MRRGVQLYINREARHYAGLFRCDRFVFLCCLLQVTGDYTTLGGTDVSNNFYSNEVAFIATQMPKLMPALV